jgi:hypothetical protein
MDFVGGLQYARGYGRAVGTCSGTEGKSAVEKGTCEVQWEGEKRCRGAVTPAFNHLLSVDT